MAESKSKKNKKKKEPKVVKKEIEPEPKTKIAEPFKKVGEVIELRGHITNVEWPDITKYHYKASIEAGNKKYEVNVRSMMPFFQWYERSLKRNVGEFYKADSKQRKKLLKEAIDTKQNLLFRVHEETMTGIAVLSEKTICWTADDLKDITKTTYENVDLEPTDGVNGGRLIITLLGTKSTQPKIIARIGKLNGQQGTKISPGITFLEDDFSVIADGFTKRLHISEPKKFLETVQNTEFDLTKILAYVPTTKNIKLTQKQMGVIAGYYLNQNMITKNDFNDITSKLSKQMTLYQYMKVVSSDKENRQKVAGDLLIKAPNIDGGEETFEM